MIRPCNREEAANVWTHALGVVLTLAIGYPLLCMATAHREDTWTWILGTSLFLLGMLDMYGSSTLYHLMPHGSQEKRRLRVFDHISIYVMIAGSYSLLCTAVLGGWMGWTLFVFMWTCVIAGIIGKTIALGKHPKLSLTLYLVMGWTALVVIYPLWQKLPRPAFWFILGEGVCYSIGAYFFAKDDRHVGYHAIWHVFILLGSACHTAATWLVLAD